MYSQHLQITKRISTIFAAWPLTRNKRNTLYAVYCYAARLYFTVFVATQWLQTYFIDKSDFQELMENVSVALDYSIGVVQFFTCMSDKTVGLIEKVKEMEAETLKESNKEVVAIYQQQVKRNAFLNKSFVTMGLFTTFLFFVKPFFEETKTLPFSSWFPFDKKQFFYQAYFLQVLAGVLCCQFVVCTDLLLYSLMIFCVGQIQALQILLKQAKAGGKEECELSAKYAKKHQDIIAFVKELNDLLKHQMLLSFFGCSFLLATISSQVISVGFGARQLRAIQFLFAMLLQMTLFYWHANEIRLESLRVSDAIWESEWYEFGPKTKRNLHIMMMRSQRALTLSVGPFYVMSTDTAINILKATYSYITLLRQSDLRKQDV